METYIASVTMNNNFNMDKGRLTFGNTISRKRQLQLARMKKRRHVTEDSDTIINSDSDTIINSDHDTIINTDRHNTSSSSDPEELELNQSRSESKLNQLEASDNTGINLAFTISYKLY